MSNEIVGMTGGEDETFFAIVSKGYEGESTYYPSIKDGKELQWTDPEYRENKVERTRRVTQYAVSGNAVSAAAHVAAETGKEVCAIAPECIEVIGG